MGSRRQDIGYSLVFAAAWAAYCLAAILPDESLYTPRSFLGLAVGAVFLWATGFLVLVFARRRAASTRTLVIVAAALVASDVIAKIFVSVFVFGGSGIQLVGDFLSIRFVPNHSNNVLLSLLDITIDSRAFHALSKVLLCGAAAALGVRYLKREGFDFSNNGFRWAVALIAAGAVSSVLDSVFRGYVLDFISFAGIVSFDIKDLCITYGVGLLLVILLQWAKGSRYSEGQASQTSDDALA